MGPGPPIAVRSLVFRPRNGEDKFPRELILSVSYGVGERMGNVQSLLPHQTTLEISAGFPILMPTYTTGRPCIATRNRHGTFACLVSIDPHANQITMALRKRRSWGRWPSALRVSSPV
jgi:hypothetical protein